MATDKRQVRTRGVAKRAAQGGPIAYAACAGRGFQRFLEECARISVTRQFAAPENQAIPVLGRITADDPDLARLAVLNIKTLRAKLLKAGAR